MKRPTNILIIFLVIIILATLAGKQYKEYFISTEFNIKFMSKYETYAFINNDKDGFIKNTPDAHPDIYGYKDTDSYKSDAAKTAVSFNDYEMKQITTMAMAVDEFLVENFDVQQPKPSQIKWIFALTDGNSRNTYEEGRPHVRGDVIFLSTITTTQEINDPCQFGFTLLYLRQNIIFGKQINTTTLPWNAQEKNWKFAEKFPTCQFYNRINYFGDIYDSTYDNQYDLATNGADAGDAAAADTPPKNLIAKQDNKNYLMNEEQYNGIFSSHPSK